MNDNRRKLTGILKLLYENTDADHSMSTYQIMDALEAMGYGRIDRKTVDANIKYLIEDLSCGITKIKGKPNRYNWNEREFDIDELRLLTDAIQSSNFVPTRKAREIITKLKDLTSVHLAASLNREVHSGKLHKTDGTVLLPAVDRVNEAIRTSRKITFRCIDFDIDKNEVDNGELVKASPYALLLSSNHYYILALPDGGSMVTAYRISYLKDVAVTDEPAVPAPAGFNISDYTSHVFNMLDGELAEVRLSCKNNVMKDLIDRFGCNFETERISDDTFEATVTTDTSREFFAWVFGFAGDVRILGPSDVCARFEEMLRSQADI